MRNGAGRSPSVLVIEDQADLNHALRLYLEYAGLSVASAYDGLEGLRLVEELSPDVVVLDLNLPRLHGVKVLHQIRKQAADRPVLVMTGETDLTLDGRLQELGVSRLFRKPVDQGRIVRGVLEVLRSA